MNVQSCSTARNGNCNRPENHKTNQMRQSRLGQNSHACSQITMTVVSALLSSSLICLSTYIMNSVTEQHRLTKLWPTLERKLFNQLTQGHEETIQALSILFPKNKYPLPPKTLHCIICHQSFEPNTPGKCTIQHDSRQNAIFCWGDETGSVWITTCTM